MHANPLPSTGRDGTLLACPPGSLVVSRGLIGGVALASTDSTTGGVLHWFALGHKQHLIDVALPESYGWVMWWPFRTISRKRGRPSQSPSQSQGRARRRPLKKLTKSRKNKRIRMSCGASATWYFLLAKGMGGIVLLSFIYCQCVIHLNREGHRWVFFVCLSSAPLSMLAVLQVDFFIDLQPFQLLCRILQWPTHM